MKKTMTLLISEETHEGLKTFCQKRNLKLNAWADFIIRRAIKKALMLENIENFEKTDKHFELSEAGVVR